eukprot:1151141-Pelagomonas_calceolata.AAC.6
MHPVSVDAVGTKHISSREEKAAETSFCKGKTRACRHASHLHHRRRSTQLFNLLSKRINTHVTGMCLPCRVTLLLHRDLIKDPRAAQKPVHN